MIRWLRRVRFWMHALSNPVAAVLIIIGFVEAVRRWLRCNLGGNPATLSQVILGEKPS